MTNKELQKKINNFTKKLDVMSNDKNKDKWIQKQFLEYQRLKNVYSRLEVLVNEMV